jgi:hypothetical protein
MRIGMARLSPPGRSALAVTSSRNWPLHGARFFPACTEPGAQYSPRSAPSAKGGKGDERHADVKFRKPDGFDANKDGVQDLRGAGSGLESCTPTSSKTASPPNVRDSRPDPALPNAQRARFKT